jgi:glucose/arabinose dehydrogenase
VNHIKESKLPIILKEAYPNIFVLVNFNNMNSHLRSGFLLTLFWLILSVWVKGQSYPTGFSEELVTANLTDPTAMAFAPSSDGRIFVTEQGGALRVIKNGSLLSTHVIDLNVNSDGERGLLGIALDPDFTNNNYIYLYHTVPSPLHNQITRYTLNGDVVLTGSDVIVLDLDPLSSATNHNGGAMAFGPDNKLYVGVGENANGANAQDLNTHLGKLLRINADGSVPSGNPYTSGSGQKKRIWAYGLRNPYTFDFQPGTGKLFINDVGETTWEEINNATTSGHNFGWPSAEGVSGNSAYTNPFYVYGHGSGDGLGCAITGGTFLASSGSYPNKYKDKYFFMDFCENWINYIDPLVTNPAKFSFATSIGGNPLALQANAGYLYYLSRTNGALYKIVYNNATAVAEGYADPIIAIYPQPANDVVNIDLKKKFTSDSVKLIDMFGNNLSVPLNSEGEKLLINVSSLPTGIYALRLGDSEMVAGKISVIK